MKQIYRGIDLATIKEQSLEQIQKNLKNAPDYVLIESLEIYKTVGTGNDDSLSNSDKLILYFMFELIEKEITRRLKKKRRF